MLFFKIILYFLLSGAEGPKVTLYPQQDLKKDKIQLLDLIKIENIDASFLREIDNPVLSTNPSAWKKLPTLEILKSIKTFFAAYETDCRCRIQWAVASQKETKEAQLFSLEIFKHHLEEQLGQHCSDCRYTLSQMNIVRGSIPETYRSWSIEADARRSRGPSMVRVYFDDKALDPLVVQIHIRVQKPIALLQRAVLKGEKVAPALLSYELQDITHDNRHFSDFVSVEGKEFKRSLNKGHWLTIDDLMRRQSVRLGQPVVVEVQSGSILIEMSGVAQRDGQLGERIPIRITKTQKQMSGEVVADARVRL
jgi:flagella basal body P-ring formation protein FlgA